jgi:N-acetyl-gamma-glutamyl-phosphate reductase
MNKSAAIRVGIVGVSGYSGMELCRLVARHPSLSLSAAVSDKWAGSRVGDRLPLDGPAAMATIRPQAETSDAVSGLDLVFLCTPAEASLELAPRALDAGARVVDLSGAFRLSMNEYPRWYGFVHPRPDLLEAACYSMPEAGTSGDLPSARLVSNPGCYATASTLAILALLRGGVIAPAGSSSTARAAPPAPGAGGPRRGPSPRSTAIFTPTASCGTSTRPRSSGRWRWPIRGRSG